MEIGTVKKRLLSDLVELKSQIPARKALEHGVAVGAEKEPSDSAASSIPTELGAALTFAKQRKVAKIEATLRRIERGRFGVCSDCGDPIAEKRLNFDPTAEQCVACKEKKEIGTRDTKRRGTQLSITL